jgi:thiamine-monophosphate kinase
VPRVGLGRILAAGGATAAIDLSDGLGIDAGRLARASGLRLVLELRRLPIAPSLAAFARREGLDPAAIALSGGDDYEILFTVAAERAPALETEARAEAAVTRVGHAEPGEGAVLRGRGRDEDVSELGYDHLRRAR